jgi:Transmembrane secretion effector
VPFGTADTFFQPAHTGLVPPTVDEPDIQAAQALGGVSREVASFASPALATALVLGLGGDAAFGLDALTFAFSAVPLARVHPRARGAVAMRRSVIAELREGWVAVRERSWLWATIAAFSASLLLALAGLSWPGAITLYAVGPPLLVLYAAMAAAGVGIGCSASGERPRSHSASQHTCCHGCRPGTGWAPSPRCRSAIPSPERWPASSVQFRCSSWAGCLG